MNTLYRRLWKLYALLFPVERPDDEWLGKVRKE